MLLHLAATQMEGSVMLSVGELLKCRCAVAVFQGYARTLC
jgi:hypothetical protein